jgi:hypothetical protein
MLRLKVDGAGYIYCDTCDKLKEHLSDMQCALEDADCLNHRYIECLKKANKRLAQLGEPEYWLDNK